MSDWRLLAGLDPMLVDAVPSVLWVTDLARAQLSGNGKRSHAEIRPHLMAVASHHIELVSQYARVMGAIPPAVVGIHQEPRMFMPHCLVSIHGCAYTGEKVVIARDDEVFFDIDAGKISIHDLPPEAVDYLHYKQVHRELTLN